MRRKLAAGNWKMNGTGASLDEVTQIADACANAGVDVLICPPATLLHRAAEVARGTPVAIGGQDCHAAPGGAHTGDLSARMLAECGATAVILGHSERRTDHGETDADVQAKARAAIGAGLVAVVCLGESLEDREAGRTLEVVGGQLDGSVPDDADGATLVLAYEPIWAIGTGKVPTLGQIGEVHRFLRDRLTARFGAAQASAIRLLYGGSVKASNAADIFGVADVDGALVGGASLTAADFVPIVSALDTA